MGAELEELEIGELREELRFSKRRVELLEADLEHFKLQTQNLRDALTKIEEISKIKFWL